MIIHGHFIEPLIKPMKLLRISKDKGNKEETAYLVVEVEGTMDSELVKRVIMLEVFSDYGITAWLTALLAKKILAEPTSLGVHYPFELLEFDEVLELEKYEILKCLEA